MTQLEICSIPEHHLLVLAIDDILNEIDPIGISEHSSDPHEYSPEVPGLVALVVSGDISKESMNAVFIHFFGDDLVPNEEDTEGILYRMSELREKWLRWQRDDEEELS